MTTQWNRIAAAAAIALVTMPGLAAAFPDCPANSGVDGYTCTEKTGQGKSNGYFRVTFPSDWDGDLVILNHGFDFEGRHRRPHETCANDRTVTCEQDSDCTTSSSAGPDFCNNISYSGLDEILLPMKKAIGAVTYHQDGWAVFGSAKDIKDLISFVKKDPDFGKQLKRVIVTGFSLGGAVTADATLKLKIDGAVPLCGAVGGGLPTWDVAQDVRLVYDFLCDDVPGAAFASAPDQGEKTTNNVSSDQVGMALKVNACFGVLGTPDVNQQARLDDFLTLTNFSGYQGPNGGINVITAIGFATLGLGNFVRDAERLDEQRIGLNDTLDYTAQGSDSMLAADFDMGVKRLATGKGRKKLTKYSYPDFTKGKGKKVAYPILSMAGRNDWLVIPEFERIYDTALADGGKLITQTWIDSFGHCVFTPEEITAVFNKYFEWLGPVDGPYGTQPTAVQVHQECNDIGGIDGDTCNFNDGFTPGAIFDRIPKRPDWPLAATH